MKVKQISPSLLSAAYSLLSPYVVGLTPGNLIQSLKEHDPSRSLSETDDSIRLLKIPQVADILNVTPRTVENLIYRDGVLEKVHVGRAARVTERSLRAYLQKQSQGGASTES